MPRERLSDRRQSVTDCTRLLDDIADISERVSHLPGGAPGSVLGAVIDALDDLERGAVA